MAEPTKAFPMLPIAHWWNLRKKFKQSIPGVVTDDYVASVLNMEAKSARANVVPYLKTLGIIDSEGKTTARAKAWRDDQQYPKVCKEIVAEVYPNDLIQAVPDPGSDRATADRWFANHTGAGNAAVKRMSVLYAVLMHADASSQPDNAKKIPTREPRKPARQVAQKQPPGAENLSEKSPRPNTAGAGASPSGPALNINVQVHISADASADQIEQIFASMAKHIYRRD